MRLQYKNKIVKRAFSRSKAQCGGFYVEKEKENGRDRKTPIALLALFGVQDRAMLAPIYSRRICATNFTASIRGRG